MSHERDFVIEMDGQPGNYRMHVSSPAGDDSVDVGLDPARLGVDLDTLQAHVLASAATSRSMRVPELERPLRKVGQALFEAVFQASAGALFLSSRSEVERAGGRLRIVLRLHPPELAVLPGSCCSASTTAAIFVGAARWCAMSTRRSPSFH